MSVSASGIGGVAARALPPYNLLAAGQATEVFEGTTGFSGIQINQNSYEYVIGPTNSTSVVDYWALWGYTGAYIEFVRTGGTLSWWGSSPGGSGTRWLGTTTRDWLFSRSSIGTSSIIGYFNLYTVSTGGTPVHTTNEATWSVTVESND